MTGRKLSVLRQLAFCFSVSKTIWFLDYTLEVFQDPLKRFHWTILYWKMWYNWRQAGGLNPGMCMECGLSHLDPTFRQVSSWTWKAHESYKTIHWVDPQVSKGSKDSTRETSCFQSLSVSPAGCYHVSPTQPASTCALFFSLQTRECLRPCSLSLFCFFSAII